MVDVQTVSIAIASASVVAGIIYSLSSLFGAVLAFLILRESFSFIQLLAGAIMLLGVYVFILYGKRR